MTEMLRIEGAAKRFQLHTQGEAVVSAFQGLDLSLASGECLVVTGPSGSGKSSLLRMIYGNYRATAGRILLRDGEEMVDVAAATPRRVLRLRRRTLGYVSQFLRVIPRISALDIVAEPLIALGEDEAPARGRAGALLERLRIPGRLWDLAPGTFSGGEQQRVNIARGFIVGFPVLLLDEPTASLDAENRASVVELIEEAKAAGAAVLGVFHDAELREAIKTSEIDIESVSRAN